MPESNVELTAKFTCEIKGGTIKIQTILNDQCKPFIERIVYTEEKMVRDSLVMMGWTPPVEKNQPSPFTGVVPPIKMLSDEDKKAKTISVVIADELTAKGWREQANDSIRTGNFSGVMIALDRMEEELKREATPHWSIMQKDGILAVEFNTEDAIMKERDAARASGLVFLKQLNAWREWTKTIGVYREGVNDTDTMAFIAARQSELIPMARQLTRWRNWCAHFVNMKLLPQNMDCQESDEHAMMVLGKDLAHSKEIIEKLIKCLQNSSRFLRGEK